MPGPSVFCAPAGLGRVPNLKRKTKGPKTMTAKPKAAQPMSNQIMVIAPYWLDWAATWVFDDPAVDLKQEPFVEGMPAMIDRLVAEIPEARAGFRLLFSAGAFPGYQQTLVRQRPQFEGWWYALEEPPRQEGWLCPALFLYFPEVPAEIYVKAEPLKRV